MVSGLRSVGIDVYQIDHEDGNGQFEINFTYADALKSPTISFVKMAAAKSRTKHGMIRHLHAEAVFRPHRSGAHFHVSVGRRPTKNAFHDPNDKSGMGLSTMAYQFLAGVLTHARAFCAVAAPTVNSYKRLVVGRSLSGSTWAPAYIAYGETIEPRACEFARRLEVRLPIPDANPYLVSAALIAAGSTDRPQARPRSRAEHRLYSSRWKKSPPRASRCCRSRERGHRCAGRTRSSARVAPNCARIIRLKRMEWTEYSRHVSNGIQTLS